jgi:hypothetical protein
VQNPAFPVLKNMEDVWQCALSDGQGRPLQTAPVRCIRWAREHRFLPEAYLYGIAYMLKSSTTRPAYLLGEISAGSWRSYYPIAFAIKTPIGMMVLMAIGSALLLIRGGPRSREPVLLIGLLVFVGVYCVAAVSSPLNIGQRHLLSIYPPLIIIAGQAAAWRSSRTGRWILVGGLAGVIYANLAIWPNYLCYFNEFAGGPKHGHQYLLDSNLDWGQDLARLAEYRSRHPRQNLKLAYFGSVEPRLYGIECEVLPSYLGFEGPVARLTAGTYVVSATQLFGVCEPMARSSFWKSEDGKRLYREATEDLAWTTGTGETDRAQPIRQTRRYEYVMSCLLLSNLSERAPDARIGWSLFVYQLSQHDVDTLLRL